MLNSTNPMGALGALFRRADLRPVLFLLALLGCWALAQADVPLRALPSGAVPNPGTQQQELTNITAPGEFNVFEFVVTCAGCHGGSIDQHAGHFGNWAGTSMASSARDPVFRANQIGVNNLVKAVTGTDGAGNVCMRCHSPNGWLSGRFDPTLGGKADASNLINSILLSTDAEGISCETCHRVVGNITFKRSDLSQTDPVWNLLGGITDWTHTGRAMTDQANDPSIANGLPYGDTALQFQDGIAYVGKYSGTGDVYFSDLPIGGTYTGQIYAVYPDWWDGSASFPRNPVPAGEPAQNSAGQYLAYNPDGTLPPAFEVPIGVPTNPNTGTPNYSLQSLSLEHPTVGSGGRSGALLKTPGVTTNNFNPPLPAGINGQVSPNEFIRTSEFCGSCHDLTVPILNHGMPEQRTYSEWKFSEFSQTGHSISDPLNKRTGTGVERCQDCHMPTLKHEYADNWTDSLNPDPLLAGTFPYGKNRGPQGGTAFHKLTGSNRDLPMMMKALYPEVDLEVVGAPTGKDPRTFPGMLSGREPMWDRAQHNTEVTLRDGVDVQITQAPTETPADSGIYEMKVKVINKSGHRIPSGYPDGRRFWLAVGVKDATSATVYQSGVYDSANAQLKTTDLLGFKRAQSNVIDTTSGAANAVMVYERVTGVCSGTTNSALGIIFPDPTVETPLNCTESPALTNNFILFDNRIPPKGLNYTAAREAGVKFWNYDPTTKVPTEDQGRYTTTQLAGGYDEVTYRFAADPGQTLSASVDVYWQTHTREFMEHLRTQDNSTVRPEGPPNVFDPNYPNNPNYLSGSIGGQPLSSYTALDGSPLKDNWGGVAYASWLATGKGAPWLVDRDDTSVIAAPAAPANVAATALDASDPEYMDPVTLAPDSFAAKVTWNAVPEADGYTIWIRYGKNDATADWDRLAVVGKNTTRFVEHVLGHAGAGAKSYGFKVVAFNGKGEAASTPVTYTMPDVAMVAAPNNLTASSAPPGSTASRITLTWNDNATNEVGFEVWRYGPTMVNGVPVVYAGLPPVTVLGDPNGPVGEIGTLTGGPAGGAPTTGLNTFVDDGTVYPGTTPSVATCYNYQVRAMNANFDRSTWSAPMVQGCTTVGLNASATAATGVVNLSWSTTAAGVANYQITRVPAFTPNATITVAAPTTTYVDTTVIPGTDYTYTITAVSSTNVALASGATNLVTVPAIPAAPSNVQVAATATDITVTWVDNAPTLPTNPVDETGFVLERSANGGAYTPIPAVGSFLAPNTVSYVDTVATGGLLPNVSYQYRVKAINLLLSSDYAFSPTVTLGIPVASVAPAILSFGNVNVGSASAAQTVTLSNTGNGPLAIASIATVAPFGNTTTCGPTLVAGANCAISVTFSPTAAGAANGSLTIIDNSGGVPGSVQTVALSGTGVSAAPGFPTAGVLDNFNRGNSNNLGGNWRQFVLLGAASINVNGSQARASTAGNAYWTAGNNANTFGGGQAAAFTFANATVNNNALILKASGAFNILGVYQNFIRVQYNAGNVTVATTTNSGGNYTSAGSVSTGGNLANGNRLTAAVTNTGVVHLWKTVGATNTYLGQVQLPNNTLWTTGSGKVGVQLANGARVDDFRGGNNP